MKISEFPATQLTEEQMTDLLFKNIHDDHKKGDCIFVFGSSQAVRHRLPKALELYKQGRSDKILFSGGRKWGESSLTEAEFLKEYAIENGIPSGDILIEPVSVNTKENVLASLLVLDRFFGLNQLKRLLVVTTAYHMRRAYLTLITYMPDWIDYSLCPADDINTRADNWFLTEKRRKRVEEESVKLIKYIRQGSLIDYDIN